MTKKLHRAAAAAGIFGAVSGALALYIARNPKLRKELGKSDTPSEALQAFGEHVQKDGNRFIAHLQDFLRQKRTAKKAKHAGKKIAKQAKEAVLAAAEHGANIVDRLTDRV